MNNGGHSSDDAKSGKGKWLWRKTCEINCYRSNVLVFTLSTVPVASTVNTEW